MKKEKEVNFFGFTVSKSKTNGISIFTYNDKKNDYRFYENTYGNNYTSGLWKHNRLDIETENIDRTCIVVQYLPIKMIKEIKDKLLPKIGGSEFQINTIYTIVEYDNFDIAVPIGYTSFKQTVTSGSVSFTGADIKASTDALLNKYPMQDIANKLVLPQLKKIGKIKNAYISNYNSTHRHPGKFSFSSVDTSMDKTEPGVLYTYLKLDNIIVIDSVIYVESSSGSIEVIDTWVRKGNIAPDKDGHACGKFKKYNNVIVLTNMVGKNITDKLFISSTNKFMSLNDMNFITNIYSKLNLNFLNNIPYNLDVNEINQYHYTNNWNNNSNNGNKKNNSWISRWL